MKSEIEAAIKIIVEKIKPDTPPHEALHLTQAALNLAHTDQIISQM